LGQNDCPILIHSLYGFDTFLEGFATAEKVNHPGSRLLALPAVGLKQFVNADSIYNSTVYFTGIFSSSINLLNCRQDMPSLPGLLLWPSALKLECIHSPVFLGCQKFNYFYCANVINIVKLSVTFARKAC
jgi:hypothetical protein